jgi:hypothetical protein
VEEEEEGRGVKFKRYVILVIYYIFVYTKSFLKILCFLNCSTPCAARTFSMWVSFYTFSTAYLISLP